MVPVVNGHPVERLFVGGPLDGARRVVDSSTFTVIIQPTTYEVFWLPDGVLAEPETLNYRSAMAPTGERVLLADGAEFDAARFDTEAWVHRIFDALHLVDLHHAGPWVWRGRSDPEHEATDRWTRNRWIYMGISPDAKWEFRQVVEAEVVEEFGADLDAQMVENFRYELEYRRLPVCFAAGCDRKAQGGEVDGLWAPEIREGRRWDEPRKLLGPVRLCPEHWMDILRMPSTFGVLDGVERSKIPAWVLPHLRETGLSAFDQAVDLVTTPERQYSARFRLRHRFTGAWVTPEQYWGIGGLPR